MTATTDITKLLDAVSRGDELASKELYSVVYPELKNIARSNRRRWRGDDTLNTTALIHETYIKLTQQADPSWQGRSHFFATAAKAMRHVLVNYAEKRRAAKRGGGARPVTLDDEMLADDGTIEELMAVCSAMEALKEQHPRSCRVVECRVFGGMSNEEIAQALGISVATVKRDWVLASVALYQDVRQADN